MIKIFMNKYEQQLKNRKWNTTETESRYIDVEEFDLITKESVVAFFKALGGVERIYRKNGKIIKLISTSPDRTERRIYEFEYR